MPEMTQDYLKLIMEYDPDSGTMRWLVSRSWQSPAGKEAGRLRSDGYRHVKIDSKMYLIHRLIWLYITGRFPLDHIDHINRDRSDNRISNLRECSRSQNGANRPNQVNNAAKTKGVYLANWGGGKTKWKAQIYITDDDGKKKMFYLGGFDTKEAAHAAYCAKAVELFGEFHHI
jgi:hypothetical protein